MDKITTIGLDLAKHVFQLHGVDERGHVVARRAIRREPLLEVFAQRPRCVVGMEACSGAHHWARALTRLGHDARIMPAEFVRPFRKSITAKNDANDAEAICTAVRQTNMRFTVKTIEQQAWLSLHRIRQGFIEERTATINRAACWPSSASWRRNHQRRSSERGPPLPQPSNHSCPATCIAG